MPRLHTLVEVGICESYGDVDWKYNMHQIETMSRKQIDDLLLGMFQVSRVMFDAWLAAQPDQPAMTSVSVCLRK